MIIKECIIDNNTSDEYKRLLLERTIDDINFMIDNYIFSEQEYLFLNKSKSFLRQHGFNIEICRDTVTYIEGIVKKIWQDTSTDLGTLDYRYIVHAIPSYLSLNKDNISKHLDKPYLSCSYITTNHNTLFENNKYGFIYQIGDSFLGAYELDAATYIGEKISFKSLSKIVSCYEPVTKTRTPNHIEAINLKLLEDEDLDIGDYNYNEIVLDSKKAKIIGIFYKEGIDIKVVSKLKEYTDVPVVMIPKQKVRILTKNVL